MIHVTVERRYGAVSVRSRVTAPSIERAIKIAGDGAKLVFPIEPRALFQTTDAPEGVEHLHDPAPEPAAKTA